MPFKKGHKCYLTKESLKKISKANKGRVMSAEWKAKIGKANSIALKGKTTSNKQKEWAKKHWTGKNNPRYNPNKDLHAKIRKICYSVVYRVIKRLDVEKVGNTYSLLGYSPKELKENIESKFKNGMNWDNRNKWHIDHIVPIDFYLKKGITDMKIINSLNNLQPLWAKDNLIKGNRIIFK
jgi:hypothetical protein